MAGLSKVALLHALWRAQSHGRAQQGSTAARPVACAEPWQGSARWRCRMPCGVHRIMAGLSKVALLHALWRAQDRSEGSSVAF